MKYIKLFVLFITITATAQTKVGYVNVDLIIAKMPEFTEVQKNVSEYGKKMDVDYNAKMSEYNTLIQNYESGVTSFTEAEKKLKQQEIITLEEEIAKFRENGATMISLRRDQEMQPLYLKIYQAIETIAKTQGYTVVNQINESLVYLDPAFDITKVVLEKMGLPTE